MKKSIFLSVLALAAVVSCQKSEIVDSKYGNEAIGFETYLGRDAQTKAAIVEKNDLTTVKVYGYYTGDEDWATGTTLNLWTSGLNLVLNNGTLQALAATDVRYWANESDKYTFLAYAPDANIVAPTDKTNPVISYTVDTDFSKNADVLVAEPQINRTKNKLGTQENLNGTVALQLKHKLARLTVKATADNSPFTFHIKEISLAGKFYKEGTLSLSDPTKWNSTLVDETYVFAESDTDANDTNGLPAETNYATITGSTGYMMLIPVTAAEHQAELTVTYTTYDPVAQLESREYTQTYPITVDFAMGKAYAIQLGFLNNATAINFSVDVTPWADGTQPEVIYPEGQPE